MINISASDLIKKSAKTICYFRKKQEQYQVTEAQVKGNEAALKKSTSEYLEMRGCYAHEKFLLFYTFDEIVPATNKGTVKLIEHKNIDESSVIEDWYFHGCLMQAALYESLYALNPCKDYYTALFFRKQGYKTKYLDLAGEKTQSLLTMGNDIYRVSATNPKKFLNFYTKKALSTFEYEPAMEWDEKWKFKEWEHLKRDILYIKL